MPFSFPASPSVGQQSTQNNRVYQWTGSAWEIVAVSNNHTHLSSSITDFNSSVSGLVSGIYAPLNNPNFSGIPTVPTASTGTNTTQAASTAFVRNEISNLVGSAPSTLDTLNELASALGNDANFSTTITNNLAGKANLSGASFTGTISAPSGNITDLLTSTIRPSNDNIQTVKNNTKDIDYFINLSTTNNTTQTQTFTIPNNSIWQYNLKLNVLNQTDNISAFFIIRGCIKNINNTITTVGSQLSETWTDDGMENITTILANNSGLRLEITGLSSKNLSWSGILNIVQVGVS